MGAFTSALTGGGTGAFGLQPESVSGGDNSLTQYLRSLTNYGGAQGAQAFTTGQTGVNNALNFWNNILSGNPSAIANLLQPELTATNNQYQNARLGLSNLAPMGGGRSNAMAQLPFNEAATQSNIIAQARPTAATQAGNLGISESGIGQQLLSAILNSLMARRGQNVQQDISNLTNLTGGLESVLGGVSNGVDASILKSDRRLKEHIRKVGRAGPLNLYRFNFIGDHARQTGFIAQEVYEHFPEAVRVGNARDPWKVDYLALLRSLGRLGYRLEAA